MLLLYAIYMNCEVVKTSQASLNDLDTCCSLPLAGAVNMQYSYSTTKRIRS